jgi:hypothetical protein
VNIFTHWQRKVISSSYLFGPKIPPSLQMAFLAFRNRRGNCIPGIHLNKAKEL